jgi:hypothetical protein
MQRLKMLRVSTIIGLRIQKTDGQRAISFAPQSVSNKTDLNGAAQGTVRENSAYDTYGFVTSQQLVTVLGSNTYTKTTTNTYTENTTNWILGRLNILPQEISSEK